MGLGALAIGTLSDWLTPTHGADALRLAIEAGLGFYLLAAVLLLFAGRTLARDWVD